jgi:hypothetical protein
LANKKDEEKDEDEEFKKKNLLKKRKKNTHTIIIIQWLTLNAAHAHVNEKKAHLGQRSPPRHELFLGGSLGAFCARLG